MDLKIGSQIQNNASSTPAGRPEGATGRAGPGGNHRLQSVASIGEDRIEISSLTGQIAEGMSAESAARSERVSHLAALYGSGHYSPVPSDVSRALISHALANTSEKSA